MQANSEASDGENLKVNFGKLETAVSEFLQELTTL
jgi:hypothetical protein